MKYSLRKIGALIHLYERIQLRDDARLVRLLRLAQAEKQSELNKVLNKMDSESQ